MIEFRNAVEVPICPKVSFKVKCISKPRSETKLTVGKIYRVTELSILRNDRCRVICDTGRNAWYDKKLFKSWQ
jgi:hypothetical protein